MKDIIKNLYWATIEDSDKKLMSKPLYIDGMKKSEKLHKQLERVMNKRQQHLFDRYYTLMMELNTQEREHSFEDGLVAGVWLMAYACGEGLFQKQE